MPNRPKVQAGHGFQPIERKVCEELLLAVAAEPDDAIKELEESAIGRGTPRHCSSFQWMTTDDSFSVRLRPEGHGCRAFHAGVRASSLRTSHFAVRIHPIMQRIRDFRISSEHKNLRGIWDSGFPNEPWRFGTFLALRTS
jgi:hypothetical protein